MSRSYALIIEAKDKDGQPISVKWRDNTIDCEGFEPDDNMKKILEGVRILIAETDGIFDMDAMNLCLGDAAEDEELEFNTDFFIRVPK